MHLHLVADYPRLRFTFPYDLARLKNFICIVWPIVMERLVKVVRTYLDVS